MGRSHKYKEPTLEELRAEAAKHATKTEFRQHSPRLYDFAYRRGLLLEIGPHLEDQRYVWDVEKLREETKKYRSRGEFREQNRAAYQAARRLGVLEEISKDFSADTRDRLYVLQHVDDAAVFKVGLTSTHEWVRRAQSIIAESNGKLELLLYVKVKTGASLLEQKLLSLGQKAEAVTKTAASEYRRWSEDEKQKALHLVFAAV